MGMGTYQAYFSQASHYTAVFLNIASAVAQARSKTTQVLITLHECATETA